MKRRICLIFLLFALLFSLCATVSAASFDGEHILDEYGLLWDSEKEELEILARQVEETYACGIYVVTLEDYREYHRDVYYAAVEIYKSYDLGCGSERNGMLLLLSMKERDFATFIYGDYALELISEEALTQVEDAFLDDFADDDWYAGFLDYYDRAEYVLSGEFDEAWGEGGEDELSRRDFTGQELLIAIGLPLAFSLVICLIQRGKMKTARVQTRAQEYVPSGGVKFRLRRDRFTHVTHHRVKVQDSSGSGGSHSRSGGGGRGSSGKF